MPTSNVTRVRKRRLLKNQGEEAAGERAAIAVGTRLHVRGELKEVRELRGAHSIPVRRSLVTETVRLLAVVVMFVFTSRRQSLRAFGFAFCGAQPRFWLASRFASTVSNLPRNSFTSCGG